MALLLLWLAGFSLHRSLPRLQGGLELVLEAGAAGPHGPVGGGGGPRGRVLAGQAGGGQLGLDSLQAGPRSGAEASPVSEVCSVPGGLVGEQAVLRHCLVQLGRDVLLRVGDVHGDGGQEGLSLQLLRGGKELAGRLLVVGKSHRHSGPSLGLHQLRLQLEEFLPELGQVGAVLLVPGDQLLGQQVGAQLQAGDLALGVLVLGAETRVFLLKHHSDSRKTLQNILLTSALSTASW